uniref:Uncharacterized protein n=1 Tax=Anopheles atroparvus TaxID=41427 RepID=A0A182JCM9_ANOAO
MTVPGLRVVVVNRAAVVVTGAAVVVVAALVVTGAAVVVVAALVVTGAAVCGAINRHVGVTIGARKLVVEADRVHQLVRDGTDVHAVGRLEIDLIPAAVYLCLFGAEVTFVRLEKLNEARFHPNEPDSTKLEKRPCPVEARAQVNPAQLQQAISRSGLSSYR